MLGHIQGPWGTEVPMHRLLAVHLRVAAALLLDYCFAGPRDAAVGATLLIPLLFWLGLLRIPLVRWSLGFVPELVFGLGFGSGGGSLAVGRHALLRCLATEPRWLCQVRRHLVDVSAEKIDILMSYNHDVVCCGDPQVSDCLNTHCVCN